jgi:hypothetical protein
MLTGLDISRSIRDASDFVDICALSGYYAEEHVVQTGDGYLLCLHRLAWKRGEEDQKVNHGANSIRKNVVYLHHGLLMNSEVWVCLTDEERCLPFKLVEKGNDVWVSSSFKPVGVWLIRSSWETIAGTNTRRSRSTILLPISNFGISQWTNLRFMIFRIVSNIFSRQLPSHLYPTLGFLKAPLKLSQLWLFIQDWMTRSTFSLLSRQPCHPQGFRME